ncbi:hypothetical protein AAEO57_19200 [Flavobacterium sp. DGU38]|uniref:Secreted protein n=1 Tax=Flavobacterium calami TaxID=3139144 RepID=A0ABU9IU25_9FLAO
MNNVLLKIVAIVFFISVTGYSCSPHCDDEDYTRDQKEAALHKTDSIYTPKFD